MTDSNGYEAGEQSSEFQDRSITCVDCGEPFVWTSGEQVFFHDKGLKNEPKRCKPCKQAKNDRLAAISAAQVSGVKQRVEVTVTCARCGEQTSQDAGLSRQHAGSGGIAFPTRMEGAHFDRRQQRSLEP